MKNLQDKQQNAQIKQNSKLNIINSNSTHIINQIIIYLYLIALACVCFFQLQQKLFGSLLFLNLMAFYLLIFTQRGSKYKNPVPNENEIPKEGMQQTRRNKNINKIQKSEGILQDFFVVLIISTIYISTFEVVMLIKTNCQLIIVLSMFIQSFLVQYTPNIRNFKLNLIHTLALQTYSLIRLQVTYQFDYLSAFINVLFFFQQVLRNVVFFKGTLKKVFDPQKHKSQKNLAQSFYQSIQQLIPEGLAVIDQNKQIIFSNAALQSILQTKNNKDLQQILFNLGQIKADQNSGSKLDEEKNKQQQSNLLQINQNNHIEETKGKKQDAFKFTKFNSINKDNLKQKNKKMNRMNTVNTNNLHKTLSLSIVQNKLQKSKTEIYQCNKTKTATATTTTNQIQSKLSLHEILEKKINLEEKSAQFQKSEKEIQSQFKQIQNEQRINCKERQCQIQMHIKLAEKIYNDNKIEADDLYQDSSLKCQLNQFQLLNFQKQLGQHQEDANRILFNQEEIQNGLDRIIQLTQNLHVQGDDNKTQDEQTNQNTNTENNQTNEPLKTNFNFLSSINKKQFEMKIRNIKNKVANEITKEKINFSDIVDRLFQKAQINENNKQAYKIVESLDKKKSITQHYKQFDGDLNYTQQANNITKLQVRYQNKDLIIQFIPIDLVIQQDQKNKEPLVFIIVQELWEEFYESKVQEIQKEKMKIFATLSHELRTPLNCSISMLEVLKDELQQDQAYQFCIEEYIVPALFSNKLLLNQINDILDFVQMDCGKFKYSFLDFNIISLLKDCSKLVSIQAQMKNLQVIVFYDQKMDQIVCSDPNRIRQILLNFLSNSLKFTQQGYIEIGILQVCKNIYQLYVKDTGIGISQDNQKQIFNFCNKIQYKNKEDEQLNKQGCGLGLIISNSLAKGLVKDEKYQGGIFVESEYGSGSKFSILFENLNYSNEDINEQSFNLNKNNKIQNTKIDASTSFFQNQNSEQKNNSFNSQQQNNELSVNVTNDIYQCDMSQMEKQNNSIYAFADQDHQQSFDRDNKNSNNSISNNQINNPKSIEKTQLSINTTKHQENNSNLSSCQVIDDAQNQDLRLDLNKIFQIQIHKNFQEEENTELKNQSNKIPQRISLKLYPSSNHSQANNLSQQNNADNLQSNKIEQTIFKKYQQHQNGGLLIDIQNLNYKKTSTFNQGISSLQNENIQSNSDISINTDFDFKNAMSDRGSVSKKVSQYQNGTPQRKSFQTSKLYYDFKEENAYEQEGFTSYASSIQIKGQFQPNQKPTHSSYSNERFDKVNSFRSQFSWGRIFDIENNLEQNKNEKFLSTQQKIEEILEFNSNKKKKCKCPQIAIVDDNQFNLYALQKIIQQYQFDVISFSDGDSAIQFIKSQYNLGCCHSLQMILMDIEMPVKNGYETVKEMISFYKSVNYANIPVIIACTAYVGQEDYKKSIEVGMSDFINKPILKTGFQNLILNYMNKLCIKN